MMLQRRAFSQVEVIMSTLLVGVVFVTALSSVAQSRRSQVVESDSARATAIAQDLMGEITRLSFRDPADDATSLGTNSSESTRINYDDVDDYHGLSESPPKYRNGTNIPGTTGWTQTVSVTHMNSSSLTSTSSNETGAKRIVVTISRGTSILAKVVSYRFRDWPLPPNL
jgi:type II secretory pathway pseudopilin PulG